MKEIKMDIPTAEEARRMIENGEYKKAIEQAAEIQKMIEDAISKRSTYVSGYGTLEPPIGEKLQKLGYECKTGHDYKSKSAYWTISW